MSSKGPESFLSTTGTSDSSEETELFTTETQSLSQFSEEESTPAFDIHNIKGRQLKAEEKSWAVCPVDYLEKLCLQSISNNIVAIGMEKTRQCLSQKQWDELMNLFSLELPVSFLIPHLDDNIYWKRRCQSLWQLCDDYKHGGNWRRMYVEKVVNDEIEKLQSNVTTNSELDNTLKMCKDYVSCLDIKQWNVEKIIPQTYDDDDDVEEEEEKEEEEELQMPTPYAPLNHLDVGKILQRFPYLEEVSLCCCPRKCCMDYEFDDYMLSLIDIKMLSQSLKEMSKLKIFRLYSTCMSPIYVRILVQALINHPSLNHLDLSYDRMNESCGIYLAGLLMGSCPLKTLILENNALGNSGAAPLGVALIENCTLETLDLKLNRIDDKGGCFLMGCFQRNSTLKNLILCGNYFGHETGMALAKLIDISSSLLVLDASSNCLGEEAGIKIKEAMDKNVMLQKLDLRLCDLGDESEMTIRELELRNTGY